MASHSKELENTLAPWLNSTGKRLLDFLIAVPACIVAAPIIIFGAVGIRLTSSGSIFFRHQRAGRNGEPFMVLKLRTMRNVLPGETVATATDAERLTRFGMFLRRYSLDELPQLINVLRGDMSIVGPRPLPMLYIERYTDEQRQRLLARPGLTGFSQVTTRNNGDWPQKLALDVEYMRRSSLGLDLKIILGTFRVVLTGSGITAPGHATMPELMNTPSESGQ